MLLVPLVNDSPLPPDAPAGKKPSRGQPRWVQCPVPAAAELPEKPARPGPLWRRDFLHYEPVLPGHFFQGEHTGGFAILYRTETGKLAAISLRNQKDEDSNVWKLNGKACRSLTRLRDGKKARNVWMMRLN